MFEHCSCVWWWFALCEWHRTLDYSVQGLQGTAADKGATTKVTMMGGGMCVECTLESLISAERTPGRF